MFQCNSRLIYKRPQQIKSLSNMSCFPSTIVTIRIFNPFRNAKELPPTVMNRTFRCALNKNLNESSLYIRITRATVNCADLSYAYLVFQANLILSPYKISSENNNPDRI